MKESKENFDYCKDVTDAVIKNIETHKQHKYKQQQLKVMIDPTINNAIYNRVNEQIEIERFNILISLARVLDDENMKKAIISLKYKLILEKIKA